MCELILDLDRVLGRTFVAQVEHHASIGSTNDRARECAAGKPGALPLLITADVQTAGRGRGANRWWTGRGSLACTLLLDLTALGVERRWWSLAGVATGVAVAETIGPLVPKQRVGLHWPNDVYAAERKLVGILVEVFGDRLHGIGIGVNTNNTLADAPAELREKATTLLDLTGVRHEPTAILVDMMQNLERCLRELATAPESLSARANAMCLQRGQELTLQQGSQILTGRCVGIGADGALLLDTAQGREKLYSGVQVRD